MSSAGTGASPAWSTYLGNPERTSAVPAETWLTAANADNLTNLWQFTTDGPIVSSAAVVGGVAYFGSWDGYEYAVNATTGAFLWKTYLGVDTYDPACLSSYGISSAPTVVGKRLFVGGNNANGGTEATWYAVNTDNGHRIWGVAVGNMNHGFYNWASPLLYDGFAYFAVASACDNPLIPAELVQVNLSNHKVQHVFHTTPLYNGSYERGASIWTSPSVDPATNTVFVTTGNPGVNLKVPEPYGEAIVALNASNISQVKASWQIPDSEETPDGDFGAGATVVRNALGPGKDLVVAGGKNGYLYAWNATDLSTWSTAGGRLGTLWQLNVSHWSSTLGIVSPSAYAKGTLFVGTQSTYFTGTLSSGSIWAVQMRTGHVEWRQALTGPEIAAPLYVGGVLVVMGGAHLSLYNATNGHLLDQITYPSRFVAAASAAGNLLLVGNENGTETAFTVP